MTNKNTNQPSTSDEPKAKKGPNWSNVWYTVRNVVALTILSTGFIGYVVQNVEKLVAGKLAYGLAAGLVLLVLWFGLKK